MSAKVFLEDAVARAFEIGPLPVVLEFLVALEHRIEPEIHRAHVERGDLGLEGRGRLDALLDRHGRRAAGGDVDDAVGALLDHLQERRERLRATGRAGRPAGSRACRCTIAAPASAAPIAASAISSAVTGRCGDIDGVWIAPVTAQVMMTLLLCATFPLPRSLSAPRRISTASSARCKVAGAPRNGKRPAHGQAGRRTSRKAVPKFCCDAVVWSRPRAPCDSRDDLVTERPSPLAPFRHRIFQSVWIASLASNFGR